MARGVRVGVCVLAGGLSERMRRDKARLKLGERSMLGHIRSLARGLALPVRVIRKDRIPRCGPLGGILTALSTSRNDAELFLACDMPFVHPDILRDLIARFRRKARPIFVVTRSGAGFPFLLPAGGWEAVEQQIREKDYSLQALARNLRAQSIRLSPVQARTLFNITTPEDWKEALGRWRKTLLPSKRRRTKPQAKTCKSSL